MKPWIEYANYEGGPSDTGGRLVVTFRGVSEVRAGEMLMHLSVLCGDVAIDDARAKSVADAIVREVNGEHEK